MITAGEIGRAFGLAVFPASFFMRGRQALFLVGAALVCLGIGGWGFALFQTPSRSAMENLLLSLSLEDRIAYAEGIESLLLEEPATLTRLVGLDIALLMGHPGFTRRDGHRMVWQYKAPPCILDIYLDTANSVDQDPHSSPVVYYEIRPRNKAPEAISAGLRTLPEPEEPSKAERSCLSGLLTAAREGRLERLLLSGDSSDI